MTGKPLRTCTGCLTFLPTKHKILSGERKENPIISDLYLITDWPHTTSTSYPLAFLFFYSVARYLVSGSLLCLLATLLTDTCVVTNNNVCHCKVAIPQEECRPLLGMKRSKFLGFWIRYLGITYQWKPDMTPYRYPINKHTFLIWKRNISYRVYQMRIGSPQKATSQCWCMPLRQICICSGLKTTRGSTVGRMTKTNRQIPCFDNPTRLSEKGKKGLWNLCRVESPPNNVFVRQNGCDHGCGRLQVTALCKVCLQHSSHYRHSKMYVCWLYCFRDL